MISRGFGVAGIGYGMSGVGRGARAEVNSPA